MIMVIVMYMVLMSFTILRKGTLARPRVSNVMTMAEFVNIIVPFVALPVSLTDLRRLTLMRHR